MNLFAEDSEKKPLTFTTEQYLFVAADAVSEVWYYVRNLDRSYDKLARLPGFLFLPALWFSFLLWSGTKGEDHLEREQLNEAQCYN